MQRVTIKCKRGDGTYVSLLPKTTKQQVIGWNAGEVYGPYVMTLTASGWSNLTQTIALPEIVDTDIPMCVKVLEGTVDEMKAQNSAYNLLDPRLGIESLNGQVRFRATSLPTVDFKVQVTWTR